MILKKSFFLSAILSICVISSYAQRRKYSNEFLSIGVGARALGMGNAVTASINDGNSGYWNPAGLLGLKSNIQLNLMHAQYFAGIANYDYGSIAIKNDTNSAMGFSLIRFGVDNIPNTTELIDANGNVDYNRITTFSAVDYGFVFSYARKVKVPGLHVGGNAKIIRRIVGDFANAWGFGLDAGMQYQYKKWLLGAMARDITTTFNAWSYDLSDEMKDVFTQTGNEIPQNNIEITLPKMTIGAARNFSLAKDKISLQAAADLELTFDGKRNVLIGSKAVNIDPRIGIEAGYKNLIFLRLGLGNIQRYNDIQNVKVTTFQPNMGIGIKLKAVTIDYAYTDIGDRSIALYSNIFSIKLDINKKG